MPQLDERRGRAAALFRRALERACFISKAQRSDPAEVVDREEKVEKDDLKALD